jgi:hypothetical protein
VSGSDEESQNLKSGGDDVCEGAVVPAQVVLGQAVEVEVVEMAVFFLTFLLVLAF